MKQALALVTALVVVFVTYYLNLKAPDLRYQLSRPIPTDATEPTKVVQQIEIANVGKAVARQIHIKIRKPVAKFTVFKDSQSDKYERFDAPGVTELVYDALRPAGRIQVGLSGGESLTEQDVEIGHSEGLAKLGLASEQSFWSAFFPYFNVLAAALYFWLSTKVAAERNFAWKSRHDPVAILKRRKPFLISVRDWISNLREAAYQIAKHSWNDTDDVSSWEVYRLLDSPAPEHVSEDVWRKVVDALKDGFTSRMHTAAVHAHVMGDVVDLRKLLSARRPQAILDASWTRLIESVSEIYTTSLQTSQVRWSSYSRSELLKQFECTKPQGMTDTDWKEYRRWLKMVYLFCLFRDLRMSDRPTEMLNSADLAQISESDTHNLKAWAYAREMESIPNVNTPRGAIEFLAAGKPAFMNEQDYHELAETARITKNVLDEQSSLSRLEKELSDRQYQNAERQAELNKLVDETSTLKARVLRQLEVINTFIHDPGVLNRIEEYEGVFAPGNLSNLKALAGLRRPPTA